MGDLFSALEERTMVQRTPPAGTRPVDTPPPNLNKSDESDDSQESVTAASVPTTDISLTTLRGVGGGTDVGVEPNSQWFSASTVNRAVGASEVAIIAAATAGFGILLSHALVAMIAKAMSVLGTEEDQKEAAELSGNIVATLTPCIVMLMGGIAAYMAMGEMDLETRGERRLGLTPEPMHFKFGFEEAKNPAVLFQIDKIQRLYRELHRAFARLPDPSNRDAQRLKRQIDARGATLVPSGKGADALADVERLLAKTQVLHEQLLRRRNDPDRTPDMATGHPASLSSQVAGPEDNSSGATTASASALPKRRAVPATTAKPPQPVATASAMPAYTITDAQHAALRAAVAAMAKEAPDGNYPLQGRARAAFRQAVMDAFGVKDGNHYSHGQGAKSVSARTARAELANLLKQFKNDAQREAVTQWFRTNAATYLPAEPPPRNH